MNPDFDKGMALTKPVVGAAIEVHRDKGPGLLESIYEWCLSCELDLLSIAYSTQKQVLVEYKGFSKEEKLRFDLLIEDCLLIEVKAVEKILPIHKAQLMSYMKLMKVPVGLLINFNHERLVDGVNRLVLPQK